MTKSRTRLLALAALLLLGLLVRIPRLHESLWYDEIAAYQDYGGRGPHAIVTTYYDPANHIFHTLLSHFSVEWFHGAFPDEVALRLPSLLCSLALIPVMFGWGRTLRSDRLGFIAALLAAVLPIPILEIEARGYSMMMLGAALLSWLIDLMIIHPHRKRLAPLYALTAGLTVWAHPVSAFSPIGHGLCVTIDAFRKRSARELRFPMIALVLGAVLTLALYAPILDSFLRVSRTFNASSSAQPRLVGTEGYHALLSLGGAWTWWAALPGLALFTLGGGLAWRTRRESSALLRAACLGLAGVPIMLAIVLIAGSWVYARFLLFALPTALMLIAAGIEALWLRSRTAALLALLILLGAGAADLMTLPAKQPLRDAAEYIIARDPDAPVLVIGLRHGVFDLYKGELRTTHALNHGEHLEEKLRAAQPAWIVILYPRHVGDDRLALLLAHGFAPAASFPGWVDWGGGEVQVWKYINPE